MTPFDNSSIGQYEAGGAIQVGLMEKLKELICEYDEADSDDGDVSWMRDASGEAEEMAKCPERGKADVSEGSEEEAADEDEGEYVATTDTEVDSSKTYYTKSGENYNEVASPTKSNLSSYYELSGAGAPINFMVVEKSAVIKFDKHIASRVFRPDELETLDSYMMKYRKYGTVELFDNKLDGMYVNASA